MEVDCMSGRSKQIQIVIQKKKVLNLKDEKELDEVTIDLEREANITPAD